MPDRFMVAPVGKLPEEKHFRPAAGLFFPKQTGRDNPGIIQNQHIPFLKIISYLKEQTVFNTPVPPVQNHQPGVIALFCRVLCNQFRWKIIIEFPYMHESPIKMGL